MLLYLYLPYAQGADSVPVLRVLTGEIEIMLDIDSSQSQRRKSV